MRDLIVRFFFLKYLYLVYQIKDPIKLVQKTAKSEGNYILSIAASHFRKSKEELEKSLIFLGYVIMK